jgi:hypothetical protein
VSISSLPGSYLYNYIRLSASINIYTIYHYASTPEMALRPQIRLNGCVAKPLQNVLAHPPEIFGGLRFFIGLRLALEPNLRP